MALYINPSFTLIPKLGFHTSYLLSKHTTSISQQPQSSNPSTKSQRHWRRSSSDYSICHELPSGCLFSTDIETSV
ncbi:hypothetical protein HanRHA438_Chr10g0437971 [Helianthus annuus]|nr:hypothetical protein HanRHA438_Chr10g0437971 [Helianthus annuus]